MKYLESMKNIIKSKERRTENIIFIIIILVVFLFGIGQIFKEDDKTKENTDKSITNSNSTSDSSNINNSEIVKENVVKDDIQKKLEEVLSKISGIGDVSVMLTYKEGSKITPIYNIRQTEKSGEKTTEKSVVYEEDGSRKEVLVEVIEMPKVEGVIIVTKEKLSFSLKSKLATAVSSLTDVASYKIQIFDKEG